MWVDVRNSSCLVIQFQSAEVSRTVTSSFERSWTISVSVNEGIQDPVSLTQCSSPLTVLFTLHAQWTPVHLTWGLLRVYAACPPPRLNLKFELCPSWNNIHDKFPTGTARIQHTGMQIRLNFLRVHANFVKNASQLYFVRKRKRTKNTGRDFY